MRRAIAACATFSAVLLAAGPAHADETKYFVTVAGRPLDATHPGARERDGALFLNLVRSVRAFDGLLTLKPGGARVTIGGHTLVYRIGDPHALQDDGTPLTLPAAPFEEDGDIFVPVASFAALANVRFTVHADARELDLSAESHGPAPSPTP